MNILSFIEINVEQFEKNISIIRNNINGALLCLAVKANAYGHGIIEISKTAQDLGVDYLCCANLQEGIKLRDANIKLPILVLGPYLEDQIKDLIDYDLDINISSFLKARLVEKVCEKYKIKARVHLKVDTGLRRIGVRVDTANDLYKHLIANDSFNLVGIYSHLACADDKDNPFNHEQINIFTDFIKKIKPDKKIICHLANSGGVSYFENSYFDMVRVGALAYGCFLGKKTERFSKIDSIFSVKSKVSYFKVVEKNQGISYGHTYVTKNATRIVTIPIGYGDGYLRGLSNKGNVLINGKKYRIVGNICMDSFMVDALNDNVFVGDEVVLIGEQGREKIIVQEIADFCNTISYEILCSFNERLPRIYKK